MSVLKKFKYQDQLLDYFIEAALDAIKRGRAAWLLGIIIVFIFGVAVFNATFSWNDNQIVRRANLYGASVKGYAEVQKLIETDESIDNSLNKRKGELGYLQPIWEAIKNKQSEYEKVKGSETASESANEVKEAMRELQNASFSELNAHVARRQAFDTVGIPVLGAFVTATDYGIIGGIALIIVGYWLLAMLRRQLLILNEFVRINGKRRLEKGSADFETDDLIYACNRIKHYMVFSIPEPKSWLSHITTASFLAAPILLIVNHYLSIKDLYWKHLGSYDWHFVIEGLVMVIGTIVWITGLLYQYNSMQLMQQWEIECNEKHPFPKKDQE